MNDEELVATLTHARWGLIQLRSAIYDLLPGRNDEFVRTALLEDVNVVHDAVRRAQQCSE